MVRGRGSWLWDSAGRRYLDFVQGWAVNCLGHSHPALTQALTQQAGELLTPSPAYHNAQALRLATRLAQLTGLAQVFFASSGAEANEGAIKLARKWGRLHRGGAWKIITLHKGYHGRTLATMSATGKPGWGSMFAPQVPGFVKAQLNDLASVEALIDADTVALMLELVQGEAGVHGATPEFAQGLRQLCDRHGLLLIVDEVQTGIGRLGTLFGCQRYGISPDIMTLGKGLGGGVPLTALLASASASCFDYGEQGGTFCGNPFTAAAGNAVLDVVAQAEFLAEVRARSAQLQAGLRALQQRHQLAEVRAFGLLQALELGPGRNATALAAAALERGLLLNAPNPGCLRLMPALNVRSEEIEQMLEMLDALLAEPCAQTPARCALSA
ncbi:acetylornithine/N-succinyldiaminopimelate aminotransferase [Solimonas aquatica]|uniref:Acetylornithine/N-succinyldiaminopimelate aminotransferase n=2 Tax=Solimonas aquatica TaxID=489703 RepID=A0A1H9LWS1_9GAMM|nr:acetylornithine/N-succinyldiaminopimelate aminotransferase [Solimonas aquatica]